jgi:hypothetical protein
MDSYQGNTSLSDGPSRQASRARSHKRRVLLTVATVLVVVLMLTDIDPAPQRSHV